MLLILLGVLVLHLIILILLIVSTAASVSHSAACKLQISAQTGSDDNCGGSLGCWALSSDSQDAAVCV